MIIGKLTRITIPKKAFKRVSMPGLGLSQSTRDQYVIANVSRAVNRISKIYRYRAFRRGRKQGTSKSNRISEKILLIIYRFSFVRG